MTLILPPWWKFPLQFARLSSSPVSMATSVCVPLSGSGRWELWLCSYHGLMLYYTCVNYDWWVSWHVDGYSMEVYIWFHAYNIIMGKVYQGWQLWQLHVCTANYERDYWQLIKKNMALNAIPYSGKLLKEKTFTNFAVLEPPAKVFSMKFGRAVPTYNGS